MKGDVMNMGCCNGGYHEFNLDWFIKRFKEIENQMENDFEKALNAYMEKYFNNIMINAIYNEDTETISLSKEMKINGRYHSVENNKLIISG